MVLPQPLRSTRRPSVLWFFTGPARAMTSLRSWRSATPRSGCLLAVRTHPVSARRRSAVRRAGLCSWSMIRTRCSRRRLRPGPRWRPGWPTSTAGGWAESSIHSAMNGRLGNRLARGRQREARRPRGWWRWPSPTVTASVSTIAHNAADLYSRPSRRRARGDAQIGLFCHRRRAAADVTVQAGTRASGRGATPHLRARWATRVHGRAFLKAILRPRPAVRPRPDGAMTLRLHFDPDRREHRRRPGVRPASSR